VNRYPSRRHHRTKRSLINEENAQNVLNMKKIYHLSTCNTCQKIIAALDGGRSFELLDIKEKNISAEELDAIKEKVGSYEGLFSKRAMKYRSMGLDKMNLSEKDYRNYMLEEYTFLKRPFILIGDEVFIGNSKAVVAQAIKAAGL
jgi:arsenate reductase (glutaredoxin)